MKITDAGLKELIRESVEDYLSVMRKSGSGRVMSPDPADEERRRQLEEEEEDAKATEAAVDQMLDEIKTMFKELPSSHKHRWVKVQGYIADSEKYKRPRNPEYWGQKRNMVQIKWLYDLIRQVHEEATKQWNNTIKQNPPGLHVSRPAHLIARETEKP